MGKRLITFSKPFLDKARYYSTVDLFIAFVYHLRKFHSIESVLEEELAVSSN